MPRLLIRIFFLLFLVVFFISNTSYVLSQTQTPIPEIGFDEAYNQYLLSLEEYNNSHEDYELKRSQYLKFQTLTSQQNAKDATLKMLQKRDDVVISYLTTLRVRLKEAKGVPATQVESLDLEIDTQVTWFEDHRERLTSAGSLDDLVADSAEAKKQFEAAEPLFYRIILTVAKSRMSGFGERTESAFSQTKNKLEEIRSDTREGYSFSENKSNILDRWMFEANGKVLRGKETQLEAEEAMSKLLKSQKNLFGTYNDILGNFGESQLFFKEAATLLKEVIREVKVAEE